MDFGESLKKVRNRLGYASATAFYEAICKGIQPSFNYSYYARIESGKVLPSSQVLNEIMAFIGERDGDGLIRLWCSHHFPNHRYIFEEHLEAALSVPEAKSPITKGRQKHLTLRQVYGVTQSFHHYQLFVLLTLARKPFAVDDLEKIFDFNVRTILSELSDLQLVSLHTNNSVHSFNPDLRFPMADTDELKGLFIQVEKWNKELGTQMNFQKLKEKFFIKRTSEKHLEAVLGMTEQIDNLIRLTEDLDNKKNNQVVLIEYKVSTGKLPG